MESNIMDKFEEQCFINLDWFYHSTHYNKSKYTSILTEGIKCNKLLKIHGVELLMEYTISVYLK